MKPEYIELAKSVARFIGEVPESDLSFLVENAFKTSQFSQQTTKFALDCEPDEIWDEFLAYVATLT